MSRLLDHLDTPDRIAGLYYRDGGTLRFSGPGEFPDLDAFPDFPWRCLELEPYLKARTAVGILSKAGCAFRCAHCTYPRISGTIVRMREPRAVVDDIERLVRHHGLTGFFFVDAVFNDPPDHARAVCEEMLRRQISVEWRAYFIEKHMDRSLMELAVRAGCACFLFSPDAATSPARKVLQKATTEADLLRTIELVRQCGQARATLAFMANPPSQGFAGLCRFLRLHASTHLRDPAKFPRVGWWYPRVYPNTPLHDYLTRHVGFPATDEELLPLTVSGLKRTFWINRHNPYINVMYRAYFLPERLKHCLVARETPHERELFHPKDPALLRHGHA